MILEVHSSFTKKSSTELVDFLLGLPDDTKQTKEKWSQIVVLKMFNISLAETAMLQRNG